MNSTTTTNQQGTKIGGNAYMCSRKHIFWPNILISMGGSKISGKHISENDLGTSFAFFFIGQRAGHQMDQKG